MGLAQQTTPAPPSAAAPDASDVTLFERTEDFAREYELTIDLRRHRSDEAPRPLDPAAHAGVARRRGREVIVLVFLVTLGCHHDLGPAPSDDGPALDAWMQDYLSRPELDRHGARRAATPAGLRRIAKEDPDPYARDSALKDLLSLCDPAVPDLALWNVDDPPGSSDVTIRDAWMTLQIACVTYQEDACDYRQGVCHGYSVNPTCKRLGRMGCLRDKPCSVAPGPALDPTGDGVVPWPIDAPASWAPDEPSPPDPDWRSTSQVCLSTRKTYEAMRSPPPP